MPSRSRFQDAAPPTKILGVKINHCIGAGIALLCIVLVALKLPHRHDASTQVESRVPIQSSKESATIMSEDTDHTMDTDSSPLRAEVPLMNSSVRDSDESFAKASEPEEETPGTDSSYATPEEGTFDCWTQSRIKMAGAPPCGTDGPVEGNAKVAIMFLVKSVIPTEPIWTAFIASAAELTLRRPVPHTRPRPPELLPEITHPESHETCWRHGGPMTKFGVPPRKEFQGKVPPAVHNVTGWLQRSCRVPVTGEELYQAQDLFSFYVHRSVGVPSAPEGSVFAGRDIQKRMKAEFAQPSLISAYKLLLEEALRDRRNSMFLLVSETCIPLHHPALLWSQLLAESHVSRVAAGQYSGVRWSELMATEHVQREHFLKGAQWHTLTRMHAELVLGDRHVWPQFEKYCITQTACSQPRQQFGHVCVADEHFVPTLFAAYGLEEGRDGIGELTYTDWLSAQGSWHPTTFHPGAAQTAIFTMRQRTQYSQCPTLPVESLRSAGTLFTRKPACHASGDYVTPLSGPEFDFEPSIQTFARRLLAEEDVTVWDTSTIDDPEPGATAAAGEEEEEERSLWDPAALDTADDGAARGASGEAAAAAGGAAGADDDTAIMWDDASDEDAWDSEGDEEEEEGAGGGLRRLQLARYKVKRSRGAALEEQRRGKQAAQRKAQLNAVHSQAQQSAMLHQETVRREASQRIPEFGPARDKLYLEQATKIREAMTENLRRTGWLGDFVPMQMHCPLMGRRVSWQAVSEIASLAWRCDGLGFAWDCLYQPEESPAGG